jgi:ABC-type transport system involved in cytochrome c biogenesis permease component
VDAPQGVADGAAGGMMATRAHDHGPSCISPALTTTMTTTTMIYSLSLMPLFFPSLRTTGSSTDTHIISIKPSYLAFTLIVDGHLVLFFCLSRLAFF